MVLARLVLGVIAAVAVNRAACAHAVEVGDFVFPKATPGAIKVGDEVVAEVAITDFLKVEKVEGDWLWVESRDLLAPADEGKKGWIAVSVVDDLPTQIDYFKTRGDEGNNASAYFLAGAVASLPADEASARQALEFYDRAIELDAAQSYYHQRRASAAVTLKDYAAALEDLEQAARLDPANDAIPSMLGMVRLLQAGDGAGTEPPALVVPPPAERVTGAGLAQPSEESAAEEAVNDDSPDESEDELSDGPPTAQEADPSVRPILVESELEFTVNPDGNYKIIYDTGNGRTQVLFVESNIEKLGDFEIREVWSPIGQAAEATLPPALSDRLLRIGASMKLGAVEVVTIDGKPTAYFSAKIPADLDGDMLLKVIDVVAMTADEFENSLFGGDKY